MAPGMLPWDMGAMVKGDLQVSAIATSRMYLSVQMLHCLLVSPLLLLTHFSLPIQL